MPVVRCGAWDWRSTLAEQPEVDVLCREAPGRELCLNGATCETPSSPRVLGFIESGQKCGVLRDVSCHGNVASSVFWSCRNCAFSEVVWEL